MMRESPKTTIRLLRRQIAQMTATMESLRARISDQDKVIAGDDVHISELDDQNLMLRGRLFDQAADIAAGKFALEFQLSRLNFLEGYYASRQETLSGRPHSGTGAGNTRSLQDGGQAAEGERNQAGAAGNGRAIGG